MLSSGCRNTELLLAVQKCPADPSATTYQGSGISNSYLERKSCVLPEEEGGSGTGPLSQCLGVRDLGHVPPVSGPGSSGYLRVKSLCAISVGHLDTMMGCGGICWVCFDGKL